MDAPPYPILPSEDPVNPTIEEKETQSKDGDSSHHSGEKTANSLPIKTLFLFHAILKTSLSTF